MGFAWASRSRLPNHADGNERRHPQQELKTCGEHLTFEKRFAGFSCSVFSTASSKPVTRAKKRSLNVIDFNLASNRPDMRVGFWHLVASALCRQEVILVQHMSNRDGARVQRKS